MSDEAVVAPVAPVTEATPTPTTTPETQAVAPAQPAEQVVSLPDDKSAAKFAALARKKRETEAKESALSAREKEINERAAKAERIEKAIANRDKDPLAVLEAMGIDIEQFAEHIASGPMIAEKKSPEAKAVEELRAQLKDIKEADAKAKQEAQQAKQMEEFNKFVARVNNFIDKEPAYELIRAQGEHDLVLEVMEAQWIKDKTMLTEKQAADMVEASLEAKQHKGLSTEKIKKYIAEQLGIKPGQVTQKQVTAVQNAVAAADEDNEFLAAARGPKEESTEPTGDIPADVAEWLAAAEPQKKSMYLTNEITSNMPQTKAVDDESDFEKALKLLK